MLNASGWQTLNFKTLLKLTANYCCQNPLILFRFQWLPVYHPSKVSSCQHLSPQPATHSECQHEIQLAPLWLHMFLLLAAPHQVCAFVLQSWNWITKCEVVRCLYFFHYEIFLILILLIYLQCTQFLSPRLVRGTYSYKQGFSLSVIAGFIKDHESIIIIISMPLLNVSTVIPRLTKIIRSGITFVSRNLR